MTPNTDKLVDARDLIAKLHGALRIARAYMHYPKHLESLAKYDAERVADAIRAAEAAEIAAPQPAPTAEQPDGLFLCGGARFKLATGKHGAEFRSFPPELAGQWVALVDATDNLHMEAAQPPAPAPVQPDSRSAAEVLGDPRESVRLEYAQPPAPGEAEGHIALLQELLSAYGDDQTFGFSLERAALKAAIATLAQQKIPDAVLESARALAAEYRRECSSKGCSYTSGFADAIEYIATQQEARGNGE